MQLMHLVAVRPLAACLAAAKSGQALCLQLRVLMPHDSMWRRPGEEPLRRRSVPKVAY